MSIKAPLPENELERLLSLAEYDLDYSNLQDNFKDLTRLAAKVAGTEVSLVNLIDTFTQWTVSSHGLEISQMPREESICQYTIMQKDHFEVQNLAQDERFMDKPYVKEDGGLRFYFGVPLRTEEGNNIGALCVLDKQAHALAPEKIELLQIIAGEIVNRINTLKVIDGLKSKVKEAKETKLKVAHDIRGPLSGIIGLAKLVSEQGNDNNLDDVLKFIGLIHKSGKSILELADEILDTEKNIANKNGELKSHQLNLVSFKEKLEKLYQPQAISKNIHLNVRTSQTKNTPFLKNKLMQITGNLISNAIKFTPENGTISVDLSLEENEDGNKLQITVKDSGVGLSQDAIDNIINGEKSSTNGTDGEQGYGFGLSLVTHLIASLKGKLEITSMPGKGSSFYVTIPQA